MLSDSANYIGKCVKTTGRACLVPAANSMSCGIAGPEKAKEFAHPARNWTAASGFVPSVVCNGMCYAPEKI
jgi:hypothetical protein